MPIDQDQALSALGGDLELLRSLAAIFAEDAPKLAEEFRNCVGRSESGQARLAVHSLKGLTASFFDTEAVEFFAHIELACVREDWPLLLENSDEVSRWVQRVLDEMREQQLILS